MRKPRQTFLCVLALFLVVFVSLTSVFGQEGRERAHKTADADAKTPTSEPGHQEDADQPRARDEWFRSGRRAMGEHAADLLHRAYQQKKAIAAAEAAARGAVDRESTAQPRGDTTNPAPFNASGTGFTGGTFPGVWKSLGPAPISPDTDPSARNYGEVIGRMTSVAVDPGDPTGNIVYVGAAFGGAWKSTNAANPDSTKVAWKAIIDDQPTLAVGAVTVEPTKSNVVLIGTGEPNSSGDSYYGMGILKSSDAGQTWTLVKTANNGTKTFAGLGASSFAWNGDTVVVGMGSTNGQRYGTDSVGGRGVYYSTNAGDSWNYASIQDPTGTPSEGTITSIVFNPATHKFYAAYRYHGFYESSDGAIWTRSKFQPGSILGTPGVTAQSAACPTNQLAPPNGPGINPNGCPLYRAQLAVQPATNVLYVVFVDDNDSNQGVHYTADPSQSAWTQLSSQSLKTFDGQSTPGGSGIVDQIDSSGRHIIAQADYNLWLGAVPTANGGTDLLLGTREILKCSLSSSPGSDCTNWLNLTDVYGCDPSQVHPDEHGFGFSFNPNASLPQPMYFANDGGIYRSLTGANGDGTCKQSTAFDNLNHNLGSTSEMVSFSEDPGNPNILLGGLQDNGSTALLNTTGLTWAPVNDGDGGYNEIDPTSTNIWYTSLPYIAKSAGGIGIDLEQCTLGIQCDQKHFGDPNTQFPFTQPNITPNQIPDETEFYTPFILDPAKTSNLLIGSCELWRGPGVGGSSWAGITPISPIFDTGTATSNTPCSGLTKIRSIAAGGPVSQVNGFSKVIYVGLEGALTSEDSGTNLGTVWVNMNADTNFTLGASGWHEVSQNANISATSGGFGPYPIADIQVDPHDGTGQTAYVAVQGFGVSHIWKTTDAGAGWTDLTNNLPNVPADSLAIDPDSASTLYLGTDVGAFISTDGGNTWEILGTQLPNVPVTRIRVFGSGASKRVRVSTYGRGLWEFVASSAPPPSPDSQFVRQLYQDLLNRVPDSGGWNSFLAQLASGVTRGTVVAEFLNSTEFASVDGFVATAYQGILSRPADYSGFQGFVSQLEAGISMSTVAQEIIQSPEFTQKFGSDLNASQFVTVMYRNILQRSPDGAGLSYWVAQLNAGMSQGTVALGLLQSSEFRSITSVQNSIYANLLYLGLLRRTADVSGLNSFTVELNGGVSLAIVADQFLNSTEYLVRDPNNLFVLQQYLDFLDRQADKVSFETFAFQLDNGAVTRPQLVAIILNSSEMAGKGRIVAELYQGVLGRDPDSAGFQGFVDAISNAGASAGSIAQVMLESSEFGQVFGANLSNAQFVTQMYVNILQRSPDANGLSFWVNQLSSGALDRSGVVLQLLNSSEFQTNGQIQNHLSVVLLYLCMLRRAADAQGVTAFFNSLEGGTPFVDVINQFLSSQEYANRHLGF